MKSLVQQTINPPVPRSQLDFAKGEGKTVDPDAGDQVDFLKLLNNSNAQVQREREAKKNGDLSGAKSYDDFLNQLEQQTTKLREPKNNLDKDDFLKLFVTQLENQDPLNPEDSTEMASRLAQFNSLEQMLNVNTTLDKMLTAQNQSRSVGMVNYIGKEISVDGGRVKLKDGALNESTFTLRRPASTSTLEIRDESGTVILSKPLGTLAEGDHTFEWDGLNNKGEKVGNGAYTYSIIAKGINEEEIPVAIQTKTKITGVDIKSKDGGLYTPIGVVGLDDIKSIGEMGFGAEAGGPPKKTASEAPATGSQAMNQAAEKQIQAIANQLAEQANAKGISSPSPSAPDAGGKKSTEQKAGENAASAGPRDQEIKSSQSSSPKVGQTTPTEKLVPETPASKAIPG